jgi:hypothetical protein
MFSTPDSQTYLDVADWMENGTDTESIAKRPILFPIIILISSKIGGIYGIWFLQFIFWLISANLIFLTIKKLTDNIYFSYAGALLFITNLSLISLTFHALTEVTTTFVLSFLGYFIVTNFSSFKNVRFIHGLILFLVLLTIIKPVFYLPLLFTLLMPLPFFYWRKYKENPKKLLNLLLILFPLFLQLGIMKTKYGEFKVSKIASITLTDYLLTQGIEKIDGTDPETANEKANSLSPSEQRKYLMENFSVYFDLFFSNVKSNIKAFSTFLLYPAGKENIPMANFMLEMNSYYYKIHQIFLLLTIILLVILIRKKDLGNLIILILFSSLTAYYIFTTGVSTYQGDRLTLAAISIWIPLYLFILFHLTSMISSFILKRKNKIAP